MMGRRRWPHRMARALLVVGTAAMFAAGLRLATDAGAQAIDPRRPRTFVVGPSGAQAGADRVDPFRTGTVRGELPSGPRVAWRRSVGSSVEQAPLIDRAGNVHLLVGRGDVVVLGPEGEEARRTMTSAGQPGPAALLSDGTLVFVAGAEAIGVRRGAVRFRTRIGRDSGGGLPSAPLPLDDGGAAVAAGPDLALIDAEGNIRLRATLPDAAAVPLVSAGGRVVAISREGTVHAWAPGSAPVRVGSFGSPVQRAAALADDHTLVAIHGGGHQLSALDLGRGLLVTHAVLPAGWFLGSPAMRGNASFILAVNAIGTQVLAFDGMGQEIGRATVSAWTPVGLGDGGVRDIPPGIGPLVDATGAVAFVGPEGQVGVVGNTGTVDLLGEALCRPGARGGSGAAGLAPAGPGAFVVACASGTVAKIVGASAGPGHVDPGPHPGDSPAGGADEDAGSGRLRRRPN